jgi:vacuolar-type H+-ATPase subunit H
MEKIENLKEIRDKISQHLVRCKSENKELEKDDCMWDSMSVDAIKTIDEREKEMQEEISKYAQEQRDNIEANKRKNKQMISERVKEIDKTTNILEVQQEKIQSAIESTRAEIISAAAAEHGGSMSDLSFTKLHPELQEFASGEKHISKSFGILTSVKLSKE